MSDFFEDTQEKITEALNEGEQEKTPTETQEEQKIKLGEKEYNQEELSQLVGLAEHYKEIETKFNTKLDKVWPEYSKSQNRVKELEGEVQRMKDGVTENGELDPDAVKKAKEAARKIGIVTQDDFNSYMEKSFREYYQRERQAEKLIEDCSKFETTLNGEDGRPAFKKQEILEYMAENGIKDPEKAYKLKYETQLESWKDSELSKAKKPGLITETRGAMNKQPLDVRPNKDNLDQLVSEALRGAYE